ncbi:MAG: efflux RND transporter permease subunit [Lachnospiraceae bacterium]|nr:efflux RND transporter permease subunit [Lachnospiraceae bacterium]
MAKFSVKRPFTVLVGVIMVLVLGYVSFTEMTTDLLPPIELPYVVVITSYPGASPERVESSVTEVLESRLGTVNGVVNVNSTSRENASVVMLEFEDDTNMDSAMVKLSSQLDMLELPEEAATPILLEISPDLLATMMVTMDVDGMDIYELTEFAEDTVVPYIERQDGVASVDISGGVEQRVEVSLNQDKIDIINEKLRNKVLDKMAESEQEIEDARADLEDARAELDDAESDIESQEKKLKKQQSKSTGELAKYSKLLDEAVATQKAYEANYNSLVASQKALKTEKKELNKAYKKVNESLKEIRSQMKNSMRAETLNTILASLDEETRTMLSLPSKVKAKKTDKVNSLWKQMREMEGFAEPLAAVDETINSLPKSINDALDNDAAKLFALQGILKQAGQKKAAKQLSLETLTTLKHGHDERIPEIDIELGNLKTEIAVAKGTLKAINKSVKDAMNQYEQVEAGKISAAASFGAYQAQIAAGKTQIEEGRTKIEDGEKQLDDAEEELADAKETALNAANLDSLIKLDTLSQLLTAQNFDMPAGYVAGSDGVDVLLKVGEQFASMSDIENVVLTHIEDIGDIRVKDIADVEMTDNAEDSYAKVNANRALMISVTKGSTAGTTEVSDTVNEAMKELQEQYPDLHFTNLMDQGEYIYLIVDAVIKNLLWGALLAIIVLILFLKDPRPTLVVAISIPFSLLFAVVLMYFTGVTLNIISLSGLALGVGMLVDNSIVVMENIYRMRSLGVKPARAAVKGTMQVAAAITSSTLTTVCVFLPIVFTDGLTRQLFTDMGLTIAYSLGASLIVAMTLVPSMSATVLKNVHERPHKLFDLLMKAYGAVLKFFLRFKIIPVAVAVGLMVYCAREVMDIGLVMLPDMGGMQMSMTMTAPEDTPREEAYEEADRFMEAMMDVKGVESVGIMDGAAGISMLTGSGSGNNTQFSIYMLLDQEAGDDNKKIADKVDEYFVGSDWEYSVATSNMDMSALTGNGMDIEISGRDLDVLVKISEDMMEILKGIKGFENISNAQEAGSPTYRILVNKTKAMRNNLTVAQVYQRLSEEIATDKTTTTLLADEGEYEVHILDETHLLDMDNVMDLEFETKKTDDDGKEKTEYHTLGEFAELTEGISVGNITRENQSRFMHVTANTMDGYNTTLLSRQVSEKLEAYTPPAGYEVNIGGETESVMKSIKDIMKMIALACVFIYLIMVAQFQSLLSPFIVIFTIPLAFTGGLLAIMYSGEEISMVAMLGFLVLSGVVVNNGIVFVDYTNQLRLSGMERREALVETGKRRMRPILMTALTTIFAMLTMALDTGFQGTMGRGMAIVTIGGLAYATLMTLFIVPVLYDIFYRKKVTTVDLGDLDSLDDMEVL